MAEERLTGSHLIKNYQFAIYVNSQKITFSKVSGLGQEIETETITEGGINSYAHILQTGKKQSQTITFERGNSTLSDPLKQMQPGILLKKGALIIVLNPSTGKAIQKYYVEQAVVTKWQLQPLDAMSGQILIDTFEIAHNGVTRV